MISPTGKGIRVDSEGDGNYGTSRNGRRHNGIDYLCDEGQDIVAPFNLKISRISFPRRNSALEGIAWETRRSYGKMFYFKPFPRLIGQWVKKGDVIGRAQSVSEDYCLPDMKDHIHFQVDK